MQRVIRRAGRASIGELVAWDVGLLILAAQGPGRYYLFGRKNT